MECFALAQEGPERVDHPTQKPLEIIERMVLASCPPGGVILDPFMGSGTTAIAAKRCGRNFVGFELNPEYCQIIDNRLASPEAHLADLSNLPTEPVREKLLEFRNKSEEEKVQKVMLMSKWM